MRQMLIASLAAALLLAGTSVGQPYWLAEMTAVHATFQGTKGNIARFGDSITYSGASFNPLQWDASNRSPEDMAAQEWLQGYINPACWSWQDDAVAASNGCYSGTRSEWPLRVGDQHPTLSNIEHWLHKLEPELAVVMWGTNDLGPDDLLTYTNNMRQVIQACKDYGTIPLLSTIPPRRNYDTKSAQFAQAMRDLAVELSVPLIDYNQEILTRRPGGTWDGTLISGDGVHPSYDPDHINDFAESALNSVGYCLRNYMSLHALYEVYNEILVNDPPPLRAEVNVLDVSLADLPGSDPVRLFPVPAAAGWPAGAQCVYDNYAAGLPFSPDNDPANYTQNALPIAAAGVTINGLTNSVTAPVVDNSYTLYTNPEGDDADPRADRRFPYHIPRLARSHQQNFLSVEFAMTEPVAYFGVYLPASSNNWSSDPNTILDDHNFLLQDRSVWVYVEDANDAAGDGDRQYVSLENGYCPFLSIVWDGFNPITKVQITHDVSETTDRGVGFMDLYTIVPGALPALIGSDPPTGGTLCKEANNVITLTFDAPVAAGTTVDIREIASGADVSGSFTHTVNGSTIAVAETGAALTNQTWYRVTPADVSVQAFTLDVCTLVGDANGSARVTTADYIDVKAHMTEYTDARYDLNGSGRVTTADYIVVKDHMGQRLPPKP